MAIVQLPDGTVVDTTKPATPTASESADWANQRAQLTQSAANAASQYQYTTGALGAQFGSDSAALAQKYGQMREALPTGYAKRGLLNSGIYQEGLQNYATDRVNAYSKLATNYQNQLGQAAITNQQAYGNLLTGSSSVDRAETARRQDLASALRNMQ